MTFKRPHPVTTVNCPGIVFMCPNSCSICSALLLGANQPGCVSLRFLWVSKSAESFIQVWSERSDWQSPRKRCSLKSNFYTAAFGDVTSSPHWVFLPKCHGGEKTFVNNQIHKMYEICFWLYLISCQHGLTQWVHSKTKLLGFLFYEFI